MVSSGNIAVLPYLSFIAGLVTFFTPCMLPLIPVYLTYLMGLSDEKQGKPFINALGFVSGFTVIFVALGASATFLGQFLLRNQFILQKIAGVIIVIFGIQLAGIINIPFLNYDTRRQFKSHSKNGFGQSFVFGLAFSSGWTPCIGPVLGTILILASTTDSLIKGVFLLFIYAIGLGIPFILAAFLMDYLRDKWQNIMKKTQWIAKVSGYLLIVFGILMFFGLVQALVNFLPTYGL